MAPSSPAPATPAPTVAEERVYRWDDPALDDIGEGEVFTVDIGTGPTLLLQPYREAVQKTANGNVVRLETFDTHADVIIETRNGLYVEAKFAASEMEAVIQLWGLLYSYPPELRPTTTDGK